MREAFFELMMAMSSTTGIAPRSSALSFTEIGVVAAAAAAVSSFLRLHCFTRAVQLFMKKEKRSKNIFVLALLGRSYPWNPNFTHFMQ